ncbi:hypothetical protein ACIBF1_09080 [Spirillospora sp. NPDC050679]
MDEMPGLAEKSALIVLARAVREVPGFEALVDARYEPAVVVVKNFAAWGGEDVKIWAESCCFVWPFGVIKCVELDELVSLIARVVRDF